MVLSTMQDKKQIYSMWDNQVTSNMVESLLFKLSAEKGNLRTNRSLSSFMQPCRDIISILNLCCQKYLHYRNALGEKTKTKRNLHLPLSSFHFVSYSIVASEQVIYLTRIKQTNAIC